MAAVDRRIADIDRDSFLSEMIELATDDAFLLHMHQGVFSPCEEDDEDNEDGIAPEKMKSLDDKMDESFNGVYYDVRIKTHYFGM